MFLLKVFLILSLKRALSCRPKTKINRQEVAWADPVRTETEKKKMQASQFLEQLLLWKYTTQSSTTTE